MDTCRSDTLKDFIAGRLEREGPYVALVPWLLYDHVDVGRPEIPAIPLFEKHSSGVIQRFRGPNEEISVLTLSEKEKIFVKESDLPGLRVYIESLFLTRSDLLRDMPVADRTKLIREAAIQVVDDLFLDPSPQNIHRGTQIVSSMVYTLMKEPAAYSMMSALSSHDPYTLQHSVGTAIQCIILARRMGLSKDAELNEAGIAGLFHDIGKVKVRPEVINKKGPLDEFEWVEMRAHAAEGYKLVENNPDIPPGAKRAILEHHEDQAGTGYPNGKKLIELPLLSRIVAVADIFNALTTDRSYSKARSVYDALQFMRTYMMNKLDPEVFKQLIILHKAE